MSHLADLRARVRDALTAAGLHAFSTVPETATPPMVYVSPGDPYLTPDGAALGGRVARVQIAVIADIGVNDVRADELDALIERVADVIETLPGEPLGYEVNRPGQFTLNGQPHLGVAIDAWTEIPRSLA